MNLVCLCLLGIFSTAFSFDFEDPNEASVTFGTITSTGIQVIDVDESNKGERVKIVLITGVVGEIDFTISAKPEISTELDIKVEDGPDDNSKYLTANRLNYEEIGIIKSFPIDVFENNDIMNKKQVSLFCINLDDESPTLEVNSCLLEENVAVDIDNGCEFTISDPDGFLDQIDFSDVIIGTEGESDIFEFKYQDIPKETDLAAKVYLTLKQDQILDFESKMLYNIHVSIKDPQRHPTVPVAAIPLLIQVKDASDELPIWASVRSIYNVLPNTEQTIQISAIDGDLGINNPINYKILHSSLPDAATIDEETGLITVAAIDDASGNDDVVLTVEAFEKPEPISAIQQVIRILVKAEDDGGNNNEEISLIHRKLKRKIYIEEEYFDDEADVEFPIGAESTRKFKYDRLIH